MISPKAISSFLVGLSLLVSSSAFAYDSLILASSYQNEFCKFQPTSTECVHNPKGFGLHGLWPDESTDLTNQFQYCGVNQQSLGSNWWCRPDLDVRSQMSFPEFEALSQVMPGVSSCLYNHEWYAHGTCSDVPVAEYFEIATVLEQRFLQLRNIQALLAQSAGRTLDRQMFYEALEADLGPMALKAARINCFQSGGVSYFSEIDINLNVNTYMYFPSPQSLGPLKPYLAPNGTTSQDFGSCPVTGIVVVP